MASAGLLKILHSGLQDERLLPPKGQPQLAEFQKTYVKGGRFTTEWSRVDFDNRPAFGQTAKATLPRRGHLITRAYLVATMPDLALPQEEARSWCETNSKSFAGPTFGWTNSLGHALVNQAQVLIGASPIDTIDGRLMEILDEFGTPLEKLTVMNRLIRRKDSGFTPKTYGASLKEGTVDVIVPLPFWFNRGDPSAALPIDAIGTDQVQIGITFNTVANLYVTTSRSKNAAGQLTQPVMENSPFYYLDASGTAISGLNGNPDKSVVVSKIPTKSGKPTELTMQSSFVLPEAYLLLEYVYIDRPEANRIRLGDLNYPIVQHYAITPFNTKGIPTANIPMRIPNPTRDLYIYVHRTDADLLNAPFLATRDLSGLPVIDISGVGPVAPWWPDASGLNTKQFLPLVPAYSALESEPVATLSLHYEGRIVRYATDAPAYFRSILPSFEKVKTPWHNKYIYNLPFGTQHHRTGITNPMGHANLDKINSIELALTFNPFRGTLRSSDVPAYTVYVYAETYNILKVYGGRAGLLFAY